MENLPFGEECMICMELINAQDEYITCTNPHRCIFHFRCINDWLQNNPANSSCPLCRSAPMAMPILPPFVLPSPLVVTLNRANLLQRYPDLINLETIILSNNGIQNIDAQTFQNLPNLQAIFLDHNQIQNIDPQLFQSIPNLQAIFLDHNQIQNIDAQTFQNLPNLRRVNLNDNQIVNFNPQTFQHLPNLRHLPHFQLENNQIQNIDILRNQYQNIQF